MRLLRKSAQTRRLEIVRANGGPVTLGTLDNVYVIADTITDFMESGPNPLIAPPFERARTDAPTVRQLFGR